MSSSALISVFEIILILIILSIQIYVAYTTIKRINSLKNFLADKDNLSLKAYFLNQDELQTAQAEEITSSIKYTIPNRIDNIDEIIYKRGSISIDGRVYFGGVETSEDDARYILTPTDYTEATFEPILTDVEIKQQLLNMREDSCQYNTNFGSEDNVTIIKPGKVKLQDDGKWLVTEKCLLKVTKKEEEFDEDDG